MAELCRVLARAIRRPRAFGSSTVHRYLNGQLVTDELTNAFGKAMNLSSPVRVMESEQLQHWYDLGARLDKADPEAFSLEFAKLEHLVTMAEELHKRREND